jgi:competence CoiA-like predicted nuclease
MLPHCKTFINKVMNTVQNAAHQGLSLFLNFPRILSTTLQGIWCQVLANLPVAVQDANMFNASIQHFIAFHFDPEDQHELLQQIRAPHKSPNITMLNFWYACWHRMNGFVAFLTENGVPLNKETECQAMFDCQPTKWHDDFTQHKGLLTDFNLEVVMHYFHNQENSVLHLEEMNCGKQKHESEIKRRSAPPGAANGSHASCGSNGK